MKIVLAVFLYHLALVAMAVFARFFWMDSLASDIDPVWVDVSLLGLLGCVVYCMRALYVHYCVRKDWENSWVPWHLIRPFVGSICGAISLVFVKAGLLLLAADPASASPRFHYGVYAVAFIAGLNVENFVEKIESVAREVMGIRKSRASRKGEGT